MNAGEHDLYEVDGVLSELFDANDQIRAKFRTTFNLEISDFSVAFMDAYRVFGSEAHQIQGSDQGYMAWRLMHSVLDDLLSSVKLMSMGYHSASGNLFRQAAEGICRAEMCSHTTPLSINGKAGLYWKFVETDMNESQANRAINQLKNNLSTLQFPLANYSTLEQVINAHHSFSHSSKTATRSRIGALTGALSFGGNFDSFEIDEYRKGLAQRTCLTKLASVQVVRLIPNVRAYLATSA